MDPELRDVFNRAVAAGINTFDTADSYGTGNGFDGRSEVLLGEFLRGCPDRAAASRVNIATKFAAYPWRITPNSVVQAARESAARLGKDSIELGQLHWSTGNYQPFAGTRAVGGHRGDAYDAGVIRAVGLSNFGPKQLRRIHKYMSDRGVPIATLQVQYSLLSRFPESNGTRETCDELGVRLIAYSPLALGLLTEVLNGRAAAGVARIRVQGRPSGAPGAPRDDARDRGRARGENPGAGGGELVFV